MKALITGISGRVGANLAVQLQQRGYEVRGTVMPGDPNLEKVQRLGVEIIETEISDAEGVYRAVDGVDVIAHLAAQMKQGPTTPQHMVSVNAMGTLNVLEGAARSNVRPRSIVLASTDQAYHPFVSQPTTFSEDHIQKPIDIYALTKLMSEQMFFTYQREYDLPVKIMRYSSVLAADEPLQILAPSWLNAFINVEWTMPNQIPWFGSEHVEAAKEVVANAMQTPDAVCAITGPDGTPWRLPLTDVRDTVQGTILVLENPDIVGDIFNLVGPASTSLVKAATLIAENTDRPYMDVQMPFLWWFGVSNEKAERVLGYNPRYDFAAMVETALAYRRGEKIGVVPT